MRKQTEQTSINPDQPAALVLNLGTGMEAFTISGDAEVLQPLAEEAMAYDAAHPVQKAPRKAVEVPVAVPEPDLATINMSELPNRQIARMKAKSFLYDRIHRTNMLGLLNERIAADRDVAFAAKLGLLSMEDTYCRKHQKAVSKLRGMGLTS